MALKWRQNDRWQMRAAEYEVIRKAEHLAAQQAIQERIEEVWGPSPFDIPTIPELKVTKTNMRWGRARRRLWMKCDVYLNDGSQATFKWKSRVL